MQKEIRNSSELRTKDNFKFVDIPKFNKIRRDLALLVDKNVTYAALYKLAKKNPSKYLKTSIYLMCMKVKIYLKVKNLMH
jgi:phenylalanyl-tRNA synthetase beta subunit